MSHRMIFFSCRYTQMCLDFNFSISVSIDYQNNELIASVKIEEIFVIDHKNVKTKIMVLTFIIFNIQLIISFLRIKFANFLQPEIFVEFYELGKFSMFYELQNTIVQFLQS